MASTCSTAKIIDLPLTTNHLNFENNISNMNTHDIQQSPLCENMMSSTKLEVLTYCNAAKARPSRGYSQHAQKS